MTKQEVLIWIEDELAYLGRKPSMTDAEWYRDEGRVIALEEVRDVVRRMAD